MFAHLYGSRNHREAARTVREFRQAQLIDELLLVC